MAENMQVRCPLCAQVFTLRSIGGMDQATFKAVSIGGISETCPHCGKQVSFDQGDVFFTRD